MSQPPSPDKLALARERLAARARRVSTLRRAVVASVLATFALAWGVVAFTGSMGSQSTATASTTTTTGTDEGSSSSSSDNAAAPLTTTQS